MKLAEVKINRDDYHGMWTCVDGGTKGEVCWDYLERFLARYYDTPELDRLKTIWVVVHDRPARDRVEAKIGAYAYLQIGIRRWDAVPFYYTTERFVGKTVYLELWYKEKT